MVEGAAVSGFVSGGGGVHPQILVLCPELS